MSSRIGKKEDLQPTNFFNKFLLWFEYQLEKFINWYGKQLEWVLSHKLIFMGIIVLLFALTGVMMKQNIIGKELIATGDQGKFLMGLEFDKSTSIDYNNTISTQIENYILKQKEVKTLFSNVGGPSTGIGSLGVGSAYKTEFTVQLKDKKEIDNIATESYMQQLRIDLQEKFPGIKYSIAGLGLIPRSAPIEITLSGSNNEEVMATANQLKTIIEKIPGADNVKLSVEAGSPEYQVIPDKDKMQRLGLNTAYVGMSLRTAFTGNDDATLTEKGVEYPVRIQLADFNRLSYNDVENLSIVNPKGMPINVSQFAQIKKMGDLKGLMNMIPGMSKLTKDIDIDDNAFAKVESIIFSMTPAERDSPELLNLSRKKRIAKGCGRDIHEINMFIKQFDQMRKMMHRMSKGQGMQQMANQMRTGGRRR